MSYALGRGMQPHDMPTIRRIMRGAKDRDSRWSAIVMGIVNSPAFLMRRSGELSSPSPAAVAAAIR